jgi:RNA polymerase sigma-B factor
MLKPSQQDITDMLRQYALTRDEALRNRLVEAHLYIASIVARRFARRGVDFDDLYQVASLALIKAVERYDPDRGVKFISFATPTMVGEVKNYFRDKAQTISLPRRGRELLGKIATAREALEQKLFRAPTTEELADAMNVPLDDIVEALEMQGAAMPASLDALLPGEDDSGATLRSLIGVDDTGFGHFEARQSVRQMLETVSPTERRILLNRYFGNLSQREVAQHLGVSQMTVSRAERKALSQLRGMLEKDN